MIRGNKVYLRPVVAADIPTICTWENDPEIQAVSEHTGQFTEADIADFFLKSGDLFTEGQIRFLICELNSHLLIGALDFFDFNPALKRAGIGILIGDESLRSKGFASDALQATLKFSKSSLKIHKFTCLIFPENESSIRLFERHGFKPGGVEFFKNKKAIRYTLDLS